MTPTEELRRMLDECGVEYTTDDGRFAKVTKWLALNGRLAVYAEYDSGEVRFAMDSLSLTPEQAIAATVGVGTCHVKAVKKLGDSYGFKLSCGHSMVNPFNDRPDYCPWCGRRVIEEETE